MNTKRESIVNIRTALVGVEALMNHVASTPQGERYAQLIAEARDLLKQADYELRKMNRKPDTACEFQGCWQTATEVHAVGREMIRFCEAHSATSKWPRKGENDAGR